MRGWRAASIALVAACGCAPQVASLKIAAPQPLSAEVVRTATSRGLGDGESCRFWLLAIPFGLPRVEEAMTRALEPLHGVFMRDVSVFSVHPVYVLYGWHCYRVRGEVFG